MFGLTLKSKMNEVEQKLEDEHDSRMVTESHLQNAIETGDFEKLRELSGEVVELDQPRMAWKRTENYIAELVIPPGATVVHPRWGSTKKRVSKAYVRRFLNKNYDEVDDVTDGSYHKSFTYIKGNYASPSGELNVDINVCCRPGIHVFRTKKQAKRYRHM